MISLSFLRFLNTYHFYYTPNAGWDWQVGIRKAVEVLKPIEGNFNNIYFSSEFSRVAVLYYAKYDPKLFNIAKDKNNLVKYKFLNNDSPLPTGGNNLVITSGNIAGGLLIKQVNYPNGTFAYGIWAI